MATEGLIYPLTTPAQGSALEIQPGVLWIRMPLPFRLDHVNLWAIRDRDGWTVVDTGVWTKDAMATWEHLFDSMLGGLPITRVICTHRHADHAGLAGWLTERFGCELWMPDTEYHACNASRLQGREAPASELEFYRRAGWNDSALEHFRNNYGGITSLVHPLPDSFRRISDADVIAIGEHHWEVIVGQGHTSEHACLYCAELGLFISGDQVLPLISSNVSVLARDPEGNPLGEWMTSMLRIRDKVSDSVLVLPSHNECFVGLHARINDLVDTQQQLLGKLQDQLHESHRSVDVFECLFGRPIGMGDGILLSLATGESRANLNCLIAEGRVGMERDADGVEWYRARTRDYARVQLRHIAARIVPASAPDNLLCNDRLGHLRADQALVQAGAVLSDVVRSSDVHARVGGEEFAVLLAQTNETNAFDVLERFRKALENTRITLKDGTELSITVSIGYCDFFDGLHDVDHWFNLADHALYQAKAQGRNRIIKWVPEPVAR